jgi:arsenate reductase
MIEAMQELGIDMAFRTTQALETAVVQHQPDEIITMGCSEQSPALTGVRRQDWDLPAPGGQSMDVMRRVRDQIAERVKAYIVNF